jgi:hypothetical protein
MNLETCWAVILKLTVGSSFYVLTRMIMKFCGPPSYGFDYIDAADKYTNKYCPIGETAFGKGVFIMTVGWTAMTPALIYFYLFRKPKAQIKSYGGRSVALVAIPSALDMVSTVMSVFGAPWISLSLAFIFKGARVVFSALLTVIILKRRLYAHHWTGVVLCIAGLVVAASSQLFSEPSTFVGVLLVLGSEMFKGMRIVVEEKFMKDNHLDPCFLVGIEGLYGSLIFSITLIVVWLGIGGSDGGSFENLGDTLFRISNSPGLIALFCIYPVITCVTSVVSAVVTRNLSAVHNGLISVLRVGILWVVELVLFYSLSDSLFGKQLGEPWTRYSALKLVGFLIVLFSTLLYDEDIRIPRIFKYDHKAGESIGLEVK